MKTLSSPILFKQIIGRGTRIDPATGKLWFRIIDYTNASRLLDPRWDKPPSPPVETPPPEYQTASLKGTVRLAETGELVVGANIAVIAAPNDQRGPILTDENGQYHFDKLPAGELTVIASGPKVNRKQVKLVTQADETAVLDFELTLASEKGGTIKVENLVVVIAEEATFLVAGINEPLTLEQYIDYSREKLLELAPAWEQLRTIWQAMETRTELETSLRQQSVHPGVLADVLEVPGADPFDVLAHVAYERQIRTRDSRVKNFKEQEQNWLQQYQPQAREVILALLEKYRIGGVHQLTDPQIFRVSPFREMGELRGVIQRFGGDAALLRQTIDELQTRLYEH